MRNMAAEVPRVASIARVSSCTSLVRVAGGDLAMQPLQVVVVFNQSIGKIIQQC